MTSKKTRWIQKLRHYWIILPLLLVLFVLTIPELENMGYTLWDSTLLGSDPCSMEEIDQGKFTSMLYGPITQWALRITPTPSVAIVYIDADTKPADVLNNTCASRLFLSRLVEDLNNLRANVIVIDKYYGENSCTDQDKEQKFLNVMNHSEVPVVVGQPTHRLATPSKSDGCLALSPAVKFEETSNVHYGLTRLNSDPLKLPLRWPVFKEDAKVGDFQAPEGPGKGDSLALVAARQQAPNIEKDPAVSKYLALNIHPYTTFIEDIPYTNAMTVLCSAEADPRDAYGQRLGDACKNMVRPRNNLDNNNLKLNGKIVVIGDKENENDMQPYLHGERRSGVWFHANYIQALLDHRFLREIPIQITLICILLFISGVFVLFWRMDKPKNALWAALAVLAMLIVISLAILVSISLFTPLWALWGAFVFVIIRYLEAVGHHLAGDLTREHTHLTKRTRNH